MKTYSSLLTLIIISSFGASAQTNTFPTTGNVGVGTTSPVNKLEIRDYTTIPALGIRGNLDSKLIFEPSDGSDRFEIWADMDFNTYNDLLKFNAANASNILVLKGNGNVGIGTVNPSQKLEVSGNIVAGGPGGVFWQGFKSNASAGSWGFQQSDIMMVGIGGNIYNKGFSTNAMGIFNALPSKEDIFLFNQNSPNGDFIVLKSSGNVGIGTITPDYKLTVNGKIKCEELEVVVDVPADYVFHSGYNLMPLSAVSDYIALNKHLPNIPSAEELQKQGWNVGEMSNKLLEKVEELTLYSIELKKENEELKARLEKLEQVILSK